MSQFETSFETVGFNFYFVLNLLTIKIIFANSVSRLTRMMTGSFLLKTHTEKSLFLIGILITRNSVRFLSSKNASTPIPFYNHPQIHPSTTSFTRRLRRYVIEEKIIRKTIINTSHVHRENIHIHCTRQVFKFPYLFSFVFEL